MATRLGVKVGRLELQDESCRRNRHLLIGSNEPEEDLFAVCHSRELVKGVDLGRVGVLTEAKLLVKGELLSNVSHGQDRRGSRVHAA